MSQRCPVCKTPLWTDPLFTPARLQCPRCGAVFKSTVPWIYFRLLLLVAIVLGVCLVSFLPEKNVWYLLLLLAALLIVFWFMPRLIDLQRVSEKLTIPGLANAEDFEFKFMSEQHPAWEKLYKEFREKERLRKWLYFLLAVLAALCLLAALF